jgi:ABC-type transporter Mla subunit MlaD
MDAETEGRFQRTEQNIKDLTDIVLSLGRTSSEHDERLERVEGALAQLTEVLTPLARTVLDHDRQIERVAHLLDVLAEQVRQGFVEFSAGLEELRRVQQKHDEQLGILIRMMDEWIRRNPPPAQA